ncbi:MAG: repair protein RecO protein [Candidatus Giovannonibacteria bacterium GW2011_GWC2_44_9]|uniref:Repair protein RecO protein n=3 Tax=Candidatus Giovannoniibacteriota TaxID=1752738 RepID=A0A0G1LWF6_9BACT|nr:MAG: repair protein RecO protein [Candidatus Giovannonibacteria bacterium GW2011_GWB1_44_23]KKT64079.1 MAG: repair protein RecO protein [Candidatus Giovannonibacteria bacterium GW2011_GWA1_44_29]KKT84203.1 MAG: repair protein RecO protein [Candidatus Giovannonibacteria bacterium GW2011_GWC2_44_9]KKT91927.1 MAG: repair protein RecO protein [Parcubacteria group bacterium GW2011_GWC1_45_13]
MKKMPFGEADFLVRVLTKDFGKMDALAKGARKTASKLNPHLDILNHIRMQFVKNGEHIPTLMDAEIIAQYDDWFLGSDKLSVAGRILQVIDMVILPGAKDEKLFFMLLDFFQPKAGQPRAGDDETRALNFLRDFFAHEGHGDSLPEEREEAILKLWPRLKN